jgi:hypothetical protein
LREQTFYTYLWLREDGTPYYVGKGSSKRAFRKGCPPHDRVLIQPHPSEQDAFAAEVFLIAYYGRIDIGTGILRNLTDGGDGTAGHIATENQRKASRQNGYASIERLQTYLTFEVLSEAGRKGGMRNVESGHIYRLPTPESCRAGGRSAGRLAVTRGQLARVRTPESCARGGQTSGLILGKKNVESGFLASLRTPEHQRAASMASTHRRWHVKRGIPSPKCKLCVEQGIPCQNQAA